MRNTKFMLTALGLAGVIVWSCQSPQNNPQPEDKAAVNSVSKSDMVSRGQFLVAIGGCNDCHSPKQMTPQGPAVDPALTLSGHPAAMPTPPVVASALKPGNWILMAPDLTAFVGPWGMSYAANITSDSATGIGGWTESQFIQTMRTGKHLGMENGRPILPPMPWQAIGKLGDDDLKSIYAYLQSLHPVSNRVPGPVSPDKVAAK